MGTWAPVIGEGLILWHEPGNIADEEAIALVKDNIVMGHVPANLKSILFHFLSRDGNNGFAEITGNKVNRGAGYGLEVPCIYCLYGPERFILNV